MSTHKRLGSSVEHVAPAMLEMLKRIHADPYFESQSLDRMRGEMARLIKLCDDAFDDDESGPKPGV